MSDNLIESFDQEEFFALADQFINLANEMVAQDNSGKVGAALRYAAARYCAFEASLQSVNLSDEMEQQIELYTNEFKRMLLINFKDYQERLKELK